MANKYFIYKITNVLNNKIYIGQTNNPNLRWSQHKSSAKYNNNPQVITRALVKYGTNNFTFEVIATCQTQENVDFIEEEIILQYDGRNPKKGYNVDIGGNTSPRTPEILKKISSSLQKYYETHDSHLKGKTLSEEQKTNMSLAAMGKPGTNIGKTFNNEWIVGISKSLAGKPQISKRRFSSDIEEEICRLYIDEKLSMYFLSKKFDCQRALIGDILLRNGIEKRQSRQSKTFNNKNIFTPAQELEICTEYKNGNISRSELSRKYGCGRTTIRDILIRNGVKL